MPLEKDVLSVEAFAGFTHWFRRLRLSRQSAAPVENFCDTRTGDDLHADRFLCTAWFAVRVCTESGKAQIKHGIVAIVNRRMILRSDWQTSVSVEPRTALAGSITQGYNFLVCDIIWCIGLHSVLTEGP